MGRVDLSSVLTAMVSYVVAEHCLSLVKVGYGYCSVRRRGVGLEMSRPVGVSVPEDCESKGRRCSVVAQPQLIHILKAILLGSELVPCELGDCFGSLLTQVTHHWVSQV